MNAFRAGDRRSLADWDGGLAGPMWLDEIVQASSQRPHRLTFSPAARAAWHGQPLAQELKVASGGARIGSRGTGVQVLNARDFITLESGGPHSHGAEGRPMVHLALHEADDAGVKASSGEHVDDEDHRA